MEDKRLEIINSLKEGITNKINNKISKYKEDMLTFCNEKMKEYSDLEILIKQNEAEANIIIDEKLLSLVAEFKTI